MHVCVYCKYVHFINIQLPWFEIYSLKSFLTLLPVAFIAAIQTNLFKGTELSGLSPGPHVEAVENGSFKVVGQVMVMSILQKGPPPAFLANWVYRYLCTPDVTTIPLIEDDIVNPDIRTLVKRAIIFLVIAEQKVAHLYGQNWFELFIRIRIATIIVICLYSKFMLKICCMRKSMAVLNLFPKLTLTDDICSHFNAKKKQNKTLKVCNRYIYKNLKNLRLLRRFTTVSSTFWLSYVDGLVL